MSILSENVAFCFKNNSVLRDVSFKADDGRITYLAGNNGAGKTTWIQIAVGLLRMQKGNVTFGGKTFDQARTEVIVSFDTSPAYPDLTVKDNLYALYDIKVTEHEQNLLSRMGVTESIMRQKAGKLSYGQRHRMGVAGAILCQRKYTILDEPDLGLDPETWNSVARELLSMREAGKCILLTGQNFAGLDMLIDDVVILNDGCTIYQGTKDAFIEEWAIGDRTLKNAFEHVRMADNYDKK